MRHNATDKTQRTQNGPFDPALISITRFWAVYFQRSGRVGSPTTVMWAPSAEPPHRSHRAGFEKLVRDGITVSTNERVAIDLKLEVGQLAESVTVTAAAGMVESARKFLSVRPAYVLNGNPLVD